MTAATVEPGSRSWTKLGQDRAQHRRLHLTSPNTHVCTRCRQGVRVVSAYYLPDTCPACEATTWPGGRCACSAARRLGTRAVAAFARRLLGSGRSRAGRVATS